MQKNNTMKPLRLAIAAATAATLTMFGATTRVDAQSFDNIEANQEDFVLVAAPGDRKSVV